MTTATRSYFECFEQHAFLVLLAASKLNPLGPSVKIQNVLSGIHTFSYDTNWEDLIIGISIW